MEIEKNEINSNFLSALKAHSLFKRSQAGTAEGRKD